jgi:hypothetical protein
MVAYSVTCRTCAKNVYEADDPPADGQTLLTAFADSVPGTTCPSGVATCPHKTVAVNTGRQQTIAAILIRLAAIEAKVRP